MSLISAYLDRTRGRLVPGGEDGYSTCCPLCGSQDTRVAKSIEVEPLVREWERSLRMDVRQEFRGLSRFELRQCGGCSVGYFDPRSLAGSPELYARLEKHEWYYMPRKWEHDVALEDLRGCRRALEVGCGFGDFVGRAREEQGIEIEGIEQNASAVQRAAQRGWPVRRLDLLELGAQSPAAYDAVCSFQVLEHLADPAKFLAACCTLLRAGGKLLLGLPDTESFLRYQFNILDLPPHHMTRWSAKVLHRLPELFPLRVERLKREPLAEYHVEGYVDAYTSVLTRRGLLTSLCHPLVRALLTNTLKRTGVRHLLRGQTLYVAYVRA